VPNVKQRLGIGTPLGEASPQEILGLLAGGAVIELDNGWPLTRQSERRSGIALRSVPRSGMRRVKGWQLTTARIAGDDVVEGVLNGVPANRAELDGYGLSEEIISYKRRWFVVLDEATTVLPHVLARRKAVRDVTEHSDHCVA
jgi:hypothetical protein